MTEVGPSLMLAMITPEMDVDSVVKCWGRQFDPDSDTLVLSDRPLHGETRYQSVYELAGRHLQSVGWTVPEPMVHEGRSCAPGTTDEFEPDGWFEGYAHHSEDADDLLQTVRSPTALTGTLEATIKDGIVPSADGWYSDGEKRLRGDSEALEERVEQLSKAVASLDEEIIHSAFNGEDMLDEYRDILSDYLEYRLERGIPSEAQLLAYASGHDIEPIAEHVLLLTNSPSNAAVDIARNSASTTVCIAVDALPQPGNHVAWPLEGDEHLQRLTTGTDQAVEIEHAVFERDGGESAIRHVEPTSQTIRSRLFDIDHSEATIWSYHDDDPIKAVVELLKRMESGTDISPFETVDSPDDIAIVVPKSRHARRFARLASKSTIPFSRSGRVEIARTRIAILSLAWLRIIQNCRSSRGWAVVLEGLGCTPGDIERWLDSEERPASLASFKSDLNQLDHGPAVIAAVAERYGADHRTTNALLGAISATIGEQPSKSETLDRLLEWLGDSQRIRLESVPSPDVQLATESPSEATSVIVHVDLPTEQSTPALAYIPPLGLHRTRTIVTQNGHPIEQTDPHWQTLQALRPDSSDFRRWSAIASSRVAEDHIIIVGKSPLLHGRSLNC